MINSRAVFVLSDQQNDPLISDLIVKGYFPIIYGDMQHGLRLLRHGKFLAVVILRDQNHVDSLEFALNLRDFNKTVPILLIGDPNPKEDKIITKLSNTLTLRKNAREEKKKLFKILYEYLTNHQS